MRRMRAAGIDAVYPSTNSAKSGQVPASSGLVL